ncbi:MAG: PAS domain-containing sensor histidine kinase [Deltaproteobacteria bacterium]
MNVAIVGDSPECKAMMDMFLSGELGSLGISVIGVGCNDNRAAVFRYARNKGFFTTKNLQTLCRLKDLQMIIELTGKPDVAYEIHKSKPDHIHFMNHVTARLLWSIYQIKEKRISECIAALERTRKEAEHYWSLFDNAVAAVYRTRISDGSVLMCNQRLAKILGFRNRREVMTKYNVANNYVDRERRKVLIDELMKRGQVDNFEIRQRRRDGSIFWANLSAKIFPEKDYLEGMLMDITDRKRAEEENKFLAQRLIYAQEEERMRIARDLHDELGQALTTFQFGMNVLKGALPRELVEQRNRCDKMIHEIARMGDRVRKISYELRPDMLDQLGLIPALEWYIEGLTNQGDGLSVDFQHIGFKKRLSPDIEITLYRIIQEALTNIMKHAKAKHASINLMLKYPEVFLTISDDGVGFNSNRSFLVSKKNGVGIGLLGMRERMDSIGGSLDIHSERRKGTIISAKLSIRENHEGRL